MPSEKSFTLIELLVVVIIIGTLASIGFLNYRPLKENTIDREARANLRLIQSAEKIYRMEMSEYYTSGNSQPTAITNINDNLKLSLPSGTSRSWNYQTIANNTAIPPTACSEAARYNGDGRKWHMGITDEEAITGGC